DSRVRVTRGPKENRFRPAIDPLFRSAAYTYGRRVIGVITSGALDDGTSGLWTIKQRGGIAIAQDPVDAEIGSMPENAIREVDVDYSLPGAEIAAIITRLASEEVDTTAEDPMQNKEEDERTREEIRIAAERERLPSPVFDLGELTPFTCPECSGVLSKIRD